METLWTKTADLPSFPPLRADLKTDVLVIGGGMAGVLCAWFLTRAGADCVLLEADRIGGGTTAGTTAKLTAQHGLIYRRLCREFGDEAARGYWEANRAALEAYRVLCRRIDCDFRERDAYVYARTRRRELDRELAALSRLGVEAEMVTKTPLPFPVAGAIRLTGQAQFHPLKFLGTIARDLRIFERSRVLALSPGRAVTRGGTVRAEKTVVATHFPMLSKHGGYVLKLYQHRSYVLALEGAADVDGMYVDADQRGLSFRNYKNLLLLVGGSRRTGRRGGGWQELEAFARAHYPQAREAVRWAAQDCMSLDGAPYVGPYGKHARGLYVASGFGKWGMTGSMAAAALLADLALGRENACAPVFAPDRTVLRPQLAWNVLASLAGLLRPTVPRCPHMGCALRYNAAEHSWDCPCHGSRFAEDGRLLDNPANGGKRGRSRKWKG